MSIGLTPSKAIDTILLVEDNVDLRSELAEILSAQGFNILQSGDGTQAIKVIQEFDGDIHWLITDVRLGAISGIHVAFEYRFHHPFRPIVIITAFDIPSEIDRLHGSVVIQKPFKAERLAEEMLRLKMNLDDHLAESSGARSIG